MNHPKQFIRPYLHTRSLFPENQETPVHFIRNPYTPEAYFFLRNHFSYPELPAQAFLLPIIGEVHTPLIFQYADLCNMPAKTLSVLIECSGNKRAFFEPKVYGEQWEGGAISQVIWKGVPLLQLLSITGLRDSAVEVVFEGWDAGEREDMDGIFPYARSLPIEKALHPDVLIAYELNGKPIPYKHGYPLRLIVPQWYGMASVKWLKRIIVLDHPFQGPFQEIDYQYYPHADSDLGKYPVTILRVNTLIQQPLDYSILQQGTHLIQGIAWTGTGVITKVEISTDAGDTWEKSNLFPSYQPYEWTFWNYRWQVDQAGEYTILARACDSHGNVQPLQAEWNRKGYGYNAPHTIRIKIE